MTTGLRDLFKSGFGGRKLKRDKRLAGREGQEKSVVPKGKNEIKDSLGQLWPYSFQIGLLRVHTFIKLPPKPSII